MSFYYICDKCGNLVTITDSAIPEGQDWECSECQSPALWEYTDKSHALAHAERIRRAHRSGIFRSAR